MTREPIELEQWECESLLRADVVGRVGFVAPDGPYVIPVNYSVVDASIVFRTNAYGVVGTYAREGMLAFQVDHFDHERQRGWSVLARGPADVIDDPDELAHVEAVWPPQPWASGTRPLHVRLSWTQLSGRKLGSGWDPGSTSPVRRSL